MNKRWEEEGRGEREGDGKEERGKEEGGGNGYDYERKTST